MATRAKTKAMPKWKRAPDDLVRAFETAVESVPGAQTKQVFGYPAAFINGQMFAGLHQDSMILRLSEADRAQFLQHRGASVFEPMPGRPMREYVVVPPAILKSKAQLNEWLERALAYASALPPKAVKAKKK